MTTINVKGSIIDDGSAWIYDWFGIPYTAASQFRAQLEAAEDDVIVEINSPGGYVSPAAEIYEAIRTYGGNIECRVVGQAASAASIIACAAKNSITPMGTLFLHNCISYAQGNHNDMRQAMHNMESVDENIMEAYRAKTGLSDAEIYDLMEENTTLSAKRAVELGFIDRITESAADLVQADGAVSGIAASTGGFVDLMAIDADRLSALRDLYEKSRLENAEGGESSMENGQIMDFAEDSAEEADIAQAEAEEVEATEDEAEESGETEAEEVEATEDEAEESEPEDEQSEPAEDEADTEADDAQAAYDRGVLAERERIAGILDIAAQVPDAMVRAALFEAPISAEELALSAMRAESATREGYIERARADVAASGSAKVAADVTDNATDEGDVQNALVEKLNKRHEK